MRLVWLVQDVDRTLGELIDELTPTLPELFYAQHVRADGPHRWHVESDADGQSWLVLDVPVHPWTDPVRNRDRRATTP